MIKSKEHKRKKKTRGPLDSKRILQAISILKQLNEKFYETTEKKSLLDDELENPILLQLTMKKIPPLIMQKFVKVHLPKSTLNDKKEVCLITGDLDKRNTKAEIEPDVLHFKDLLKKEKISQINEVITLRQLRKEYKPYEARRQLCGAYDVFLCDKRIAGVLPRTLGKAFFKKRKLPIQINMQTPKLREQIENALSSTVFHITCKGNSCSSEVANLSMKEKDILSNIMSSIDALKEQLPGQWNNVLSIYVKTPKSKAIPLYMSNDDPNDFNFTEIGEQYESFTDELSTFDNTDVEVFKDGRVIVKNPRLKGEDIENLDALWELSDETVSDDEITLDEESTEEQEHASDGEAVDDNEIGMESSEESAQVEEERFENFEVQKPEKKSKKPKTKLGFYEESSKVEDKEDNVANAQEPEKKRKKQKSSLKLTEESSEVEDIEEYVANVEKSEKKSKKQKSSLKFTEESSEVENIEENVQKPEKKHKKQKSSLKLTEESSAVEDLEEYVANVQKPEKKHKKQRSLKFTEESSEVEDIEENVQKPEKKRKKQKSSLKLTEESSAVEDLEEFVVNAQKPEKKHKKQKSLKFTEESSEVEEEYAVNAQKPETKNKKRKSNLEFNEKSFDVEIIGESSENSVKIMKNKSKKKKNKK